MGFRSSCKVLVDVKLLDCILHEFWVVWINLFAMCITIEKSLLCILELAKFALAGSGWSNEVEDQIQECVHVWAEKW